VSVIVILPRVEKATDSYHSEGALVSVADSEDAARYNLASLPHITITDEEWVKRVVYELMDNQPERVFVFPDAGCC